MPQMLKKSKDGLQFLWVAVMIPPLHIVHWKDIKDYTVKNGGQIHSPLSVQICNLKFSQN